MTNCDFEAFAKAYQAGESQVIWHETSADLETPVAAFIKLTHTQQHNCFLLESVEDGDIRGRYSIIGIDPDVIFRVRDGKPERHNTNGKTGFAPCPAQSPFDALRVVLAESRIALPDALPPMAVGVFGYMAYDMVRHIESLPDANPPALDTPDSLFIRPTITVVFDAVTDSLKIVTPIRPAKNISARAAYDAAQLRLADIRARLSASLPPPPLAAVEELQPPNSNMSREAYFKMVDRAKDYIRDGDVFQVVVSQRFSTRFTLPPFDFYRALRRVNPSPYLFFMRFEDFAIIGSSPEVLVGLQDRRVNIRPIAGTRKRGDSPEDDKRIGQELLADEKERAEHLMLLDLGRNDVGRVSEIGSVAVTQSFELQKTSHLIHIVSDVGGTLSPQHDCLDALQAGFPAGTVSGAPKIRAMEIIDELEPERRGIYAGCIGYFSANGDMDSCIALRTAIIKDDTLYVQAGGGIVYDSTPQYEYDETVNKAAALFRAAQLAVETAQKRDNHS